MLQYWRLALTLLFVLGMIGFFSAAIQVLLLAFAAILGGVLLDAPTSFLTRRLSIPRPLALLTVIGTIVGLTVSIGFIVGPPLHEQFLHLSETLPPAARSMMRGFERSDVGEQILDPLPPVEDMVNAPKLVGGVAGVVTTIAGGLAGVLFVVVVSIFLAIAPQSYVKPAVRLIPPAYRDVARRLIEIWGLNLRHWLVARFASMVAVGVLTGLGLWVVNIPAAASLGLLAGILSFIPNLGPTLAALPGVLLGLSSSPTSALLAASVYVGVQILEGNLITPYAEQRAVSLPPAFLITVQLLMGLLVGVIGLLVATPLIVVATIAVQELYVKRIESSPLASPLVVDEVA